jgi:hypothetical protein
MSIYLGEFCEDHHIIRLKKVMKFTKNAQIGATTEGTTFFCVNSRREKRRQAKYL